MVTISPSMDFAEPRVAKPSAPVSARDPRLDVFRGIAMYIILIAHIPNDPWALWIPARFGFSDATEIFVFCSGMASAIAFGGAFNQRGWLMGTARVAYRCWQVYWAHIALFFFTAMAMAAIDAWWPGETSYVGQLNLQPFFDRTAQQLLGLFTLTYVPNYFDVLPMYLVVLAMMPLVMALQRMHLAAAVLFSVSLWLAANVGTLHLPAEPWSTREWFFNPFGWQLLFFTGFALMRGWIPAPPVSKALLWTAAAFLILSAPFGSWKVLNWVEALSPALGDWIKDIWGWMDHQDIPANFSPRDKTDFAILRYLHFLSLAYLAWAAAGPGGSQLRALTDGAAGNGVRLLIAVITKVGQQSLAVFVASMALAQVLGFLADQMGRNAANHLVVNLLGFAMITAVAYIAGWFKSQPWRSKRK
ncbi:MAG: OpgC domain-containing protein [Pseudooceanicola sp.]|nr:OpgC domain-containing protein [Pseudooceanicola sp.]